MATTNTNVDRELLQILLQEQGLDVADIADCASIPRLRDRQKSLPSFAQRRMLFLSQADPASPAYNLATAVRIRGALDVTALRVGINEIVRRHEVLRTCFRIVDDEPALHVLSGVEVELPVVNLRDVPRQHRDRALRRQLVDHARQTFDLACEAPLRVTLFHLDEHEYAALLLAHHIAVDGWSMQIFVRELTQLYAAFLAGQPSPLADLPIQYRDFAHWQRERDAQGEFAAQKEYWTHQLAGAAKLELPTDKPRPATPTGRGATHTFVVPPAIAQALQRLADQEQATSFMTLLTVFNVLLHRYAQQDDIVVGAPIANRNHRDVEPLIGFFVNTLVMRCDYSGHPTFRQLLRQVKHTALAAYEHQDLPFERLVSQLMPQRDNAANPLFQVMFSVEEAGPLALELTDLSISPLDVETGIAKFDLLLNMTSTGAHLAGGLEYSTDLFEAATIQRLAEHFINLATAAVENPDSPIAKLSILSQSERQQILVDWNGASTEYPRNTGIHELFQRQAERSPQAVAVEFGGQQLSYAELNERANRLANFLIKSGVNTGTLVALFVERSVDMVVGMLGILKAGGAYLPIDMAYPQQRIAFMLDDCRVPVLLTQQSLLDHLPELAANVVCLDSDWNSIAVESSDDPQRPVSGDQLAYVIFTSGSTGVPKGVAVQHRAVNRLVLNTNYVGLDPSDRIAQASNASFDAATFEIWGTLLNGARLVGVPRDTTLAPDQFAAFLREQNITTLFLTTALFNQISRDKPTAFRTLKQVLFGGEAVDPQWVRRVLEHGPPSRLLHVYGPTENTTFSTWHLVRHVPERATRIPIGGPICNTAIYVLDDRLQPVPVGIPGELYLGGDGLADGYVNRPELTAEKFVPHPFDETPGAKLYKTGDLVRWTVDGVIEFLGRRDQQVKIRGFRVELSEVEAVVLQHADVRDAVVVAREDEPNRRQLVAYCLAKIDAHLDIGSLRSYLESKLPSYMIPAHFVQLDRFPFTPNGKIDKRALPAPLDVESDGASPYQPPRNEREQLLVDAFQAVLGRQKVGTQDNYFELGGDSITAIQVATRLRRAGWKLAIRDLFQNPSVVELAPRLRPQHREATAPDRAVTGPVPLTAIQRWFFHRMHGEIHHFNQAVLLKSRRRADPDALRDALRAIHNHHDALRMTFSVSDGEVRQLNRDVDHPFSFEQIDFTSETDPTSALTASASRVQQSLDLECGPLMKAVLCRLPTTDRLLLVVHHLVVDGVSWRILLEDLETAYQQLLAGEAVELGPKSMSFKTWSEAVAAYSTSQKLLAELDYWCREDQVTATSLPRLHDVGAGLYGDSQSLATRLTEQQTEELLTQSHRAYHTEINDILLTALGRALGKWHGGRATWLTMEGHGREPLGQELDVHRTVGWFTAMYPFLLHVPAGDLGTQIKHVKESLRRVPGKGMNYGILRYVTPQHSTDVQVPDRRPQISFNYLGQFDSARDNRAFEFAEEATGDDISPKLPRLHDLDVVALISGGRFVLSVRFDPRLQLPATVEGFLSDFKGELIELVQHCVDQEGSERTASDFAFAGLSVDDFESIRKKLDAN